MMSHSCGKRKHKNSREIDSAKTAQGPRNVGCTYVSFDPFLVHIVLMIIGSLRPSRSQTLVVSRMEALSATIRCVWLFGRVV